MESIAIFLSSRNNYDMFPIFLEKFFVAWSTAFTLLSRMLYSFCALFIAFIFLLSADNRFAKVFCAFNLFLFSFSYASARPKFSLACCFITLFSSCKRTLFFTVPLLTTPFTVRNFSFVLIKATTEDLFCFWAIVNFSTAVTCFFLASIKGVFVVVVLKLFSISISSKIPFLILLNEDKAVSSSFSICLIDGVKRVSL